VMQIFGGRNGRCRGQDRGRGVKKSFSNCESCVVVEAR
jgi:hypothetical protein